MQRFKKTFVRRRGIAVRKGKPRICPLTDQVTRCNGLCKIVDPPNDVKICPIYRTLFFEEPICKIGVSKCPYVGSPIKQDPVKPGVFSRVRCPRCKTIQPLAPGLPMTCKICGFNFVPKQFAEVIVHGTESL